MQSEVPAPPVSGGGGGDELLPLTRSNSSIGSTSTGTVAVSSSLSSSNPFFVWTSSQIQETILCVLLSVFGWYGPKHLLYPSEESILSREIPMMQLSSSAPGSAAAAATDTFLLDSRYNHPVVDPPTISGDLLVFAGVWVPLGLVFALQFCRRRNPSSVLCAILAAVGVAESLTNLGKYYVRRPRPNFYALCGWDATARTCTAPFRRIVEAQLSFPSGHSSLSFCTATVVALWFWTILQADDHAQQQQAQRRRNKWQTLVACLIPWMWAAFVATSRIVDYWHHPSDVLAGSILGFFSATLCFTIFHSSPSMPSSGGSGGLPKLATFNE